LHREAEGGYTVSVPVLPGCITYGEDVEEAIVKNIETDEAPTKQEIVRN